MENEKNINIDYDAGVYIESFCWFYSGNKTISGHESRDDNVSVDNTEFNQNALSNFASTTYEKLCNITRFLSRKSYMNSGIVIVND